ncbi:chemotaxis response regulator protein-glutamate methylesterase [Paenibacillus sp. GCM10028914]|uniref:protein-glutamate methylesterase/protein-glutamine glutaminase n=1 Tax=Paenibacillus sp. GCM10028914 TaxID=3273416 RepID=UPI00361AD1F3
MTPFRVLVVDDSPFMRKIFSDLIERDDRFRVVGTATNGKEAISKVKELKPDVITMDVEMPEMNGLDALRSIMESERQMVIMLSGVNEQGMRETILALEFGAFDFIRKPSILNAQDIEQVGCELLCQLNAAMQAKERRALWEEEEQRRLDHSKATPLSPRPSDRQTPLRTSESLKAPSTRSVRKEVSNVHKNNEEMQTVKLPKTDPFKSSVDSKVTKDRKGSVGKSKEQGITPAPDINRVDRNDQLSNSKFLNQAAHKESDVKTEFVREHLIGQRFNQIVAVGCSTGGPRALKTFLEGIPADFPAPIVIVQHMPPNFTKSLAQRLDTFSALDVVEAYDGMFLKAGVAYIAPGGSHMTISQSMDGQFQITIRKGDPCNGHRPSVDVLFESLLPFSSLNRHVVLMTGMGSDGAKMMKKLYDSGVTSTFAESEETCVVYGMPRSAVELGCVSYVLPLQNISGKLVQAVNISK